MKELSVPHAYLVTPDLHRDDRGTFLEVFHAGRFAEVAGRPLHAAQVNCSVSRRGVLRGVHFSDVPPGQGKYVTCVSGAVLDVVVDLRVGSPAFGRWEAVRLDDESRHALYVSEGLGHAFMALTDQATVMYLCSTSYAPGREHEVHPLDPALGIEWPPEVAPVLSAKDAAAPNLAEAVALGVLPRYEDCLALYAGAAGSAPVG
ncbi:dTDP-4-dehydrorhamnose 3,5-epimerase [Sphaerisporangium rufum]|uniref:dTDP-4-dehydrorhamnose 3,5-epimerase n=1 Tax=Sphaerisporangium rufum TaxID=1381558 RepID=A0A919V7U8_9ACTN|nr:dTDP-4-dehydrorhamnose 3,5-epimerase [Sphaerisporangium rufum]GII80745.1 dTDP-4-dehydrorhamnose 3,5-epimerase [Sphaerisporangium rufum]